MSGRRRLLIGAISYADAEPALQVARALLGAGVDDLSGVLVDQPPDIGTLPAHARQVVTARGTLCAAPDGGARRRLRDSDARAFRAALQQIALGARVTWEFRLETGAPLHRLIRSAGATDMLVIGYRRIGPLPGQVLAILPGTGDAMALRQISQTLAAALHTGMTELTHDQPTPTLLARISRTRAAAVVVDATAWAPEQLEQLVEIARCPVLILRPRPD